MKSMRYAMLVGATLGCLFASQAMAQAFPQRTIKMITPVAAGGGSDSMARIMAEKVQPLLGQPMIVENKPGANSVIAVQYLLQQPADGYNLILSNSVMALRTAEPDSPYDVRKDLDDVIQVGSGTYILYVSPKLPVHSVKELIAYGKANPGKLNFSTLGVGTAVHLCIELLAQRGGFSMTTIPYSGSATSIQAVLAGDVQASVDSYTLLKGHGDAGRLRLLAVTSAKRWDQAPELPGMEEAGVPDYDVNFWIGVAAKKGTPPAVLATLGSTFGKILADPNVKEGIRKLGTVVTGLSGAQLTKINEREVQVWTDVVKRANIKFE